MMCTVQVLLMTDVMGLPQADRHSVPPRNICRRLFAADEDEVQRRAQFLSAVHEDIEKKNRERWNFDFRSGTPLPGRYQWVPVCPGVLRNEVPVADDRPSSSFSQKSKKVNKTTTQSKITDFLFQRKRHRTAENSPFSKLKSRRLEQQQHSTAII